MKPLGYILSGVTIAALITAAVKPQLTWVAALLLGLLLPIPCPVSFCTARPKTIWVSSTA